MPVAVEHIVVIVRPLAAGRLFEARLSVSIGLITCQTKIGYLPASNRLKPAPVSARALTAPE